MQSDELVPQLCPLETVFHTHVIGPMSPSSRAPISPLARRYRMPEGASLPAAGCIIRGDFLEQVEIAEEVVMAARRQAAELLDRATLEANVLAEVATQDAQAQVWESAAALLQRLDHACSSLLTQSEELLMETVCAALRRLMLDVPPDWPSLSGIRLLLHELPATQASDQWGLRVHPDDVASLKSHVETKLPVTLSADATLTRGQCVLACAQGELRADYRASVEALVVSLQRPPAADSPVPFSSPDRRVIP